MENEKKAFENVTHYTNVDVQPGGINIQHVEHLHQADVLKALGIELEIKKPGQESDTKNPDGTKRDCIQQDEELFHFIHPAVTDDKERVQIHREVENLVCNNTIPNICAYLNEMAKEKRILQPIEPKIAMTELRRMGMPGEDAQGFSEKNFQKYYRK